MKLTVLLSLLVLGALGLAACAGGDETTVAPETTAADASGAADTTLSRDEELVRIAERWAQLLAAGERCNRYMGQPACERLNCYRPGTGPIKNCRRPTPGFQRSFADATVRELVVKRHRAGVRFSNGVVVEFVSGEYQLPAWVVGEVGHGASSEFFHQPPLPGDQEQIAKLVNEWAPSFASDDLKACRYMRWVACEEFYDYDDGFEPPDGDPSRFQRSFAGATVERVAFENPYADPVVAAAELSNGESVQLLPSAEASGWGITSLGEDLDGERPRSELEMIAKRGNRWARGFAKMNGLSACRYMGQPACERMGCERVGTGPIKNCAPIPAEYRESFADATVEWVAFDGSYDTAEHSNATAEFSNGEAVQFEGPGDWYVAETWVKRIARRNVSP